MDFTTSDNSTTFSISSYVSPKNIIYSPTMDFVVFAPVIHDQQEIKNEKEEEPMENLYKIVVVTKDREIILDSKTVAKDADEAKFNVDVNGVLKENKLKPRDVTIICKCWGSVAVRQEVQKVKLVDKDEE